MSVTSATGSALNNAIYVLDVDSVRRLLASGESMLGASLSRYNPMIALARMSAALVSDDDGSNADLWSRFNSIRFLLQKAGARF